MVQLLVLLLFFPRFWRNYLLFAVFLQRYKWSTSVLLCYFWKAQVLLLWYIFTSFLIVIKYVSKSSLFAGSSLSYSRRWYRRQSSTVLSMTWVVSIYSSKQRRYINIFCEEPQKKSHCFCIWFALLHLTLSILP